MKCVWVLRVWLAVLLLTTFGSSTKAFACTSCGSGGSDPLILYPNEKWKLYAGYTYQNNFTNITASGEETANYGPSEKNSLILSGGYLFSPRSFVTLTVPVVRNTRDDREKIGVSDASLFSRYTVVQQTFDEEWVPQVQIMVGYKHSMSRSIHTTQDFEMLDVFGNGFSEVKGGIDIWFGMSQIKGGLAQLFSYNLPKHVGGEKLERGVVSRSTVTLGVSYDAMGKVLIGANRSHTSKLKIDGEEQPDSEVVDNSYFVTVDYGITMADVLRFTWSQAAAFGDNSNTFKGDSITLAYMRTFY